MVDPIIVAPPPRSIDEIIAGHGPRPVEVRFIEGPAKGTILPILGGQVVVDEAGDVRHTGSLSVAATTLWTPDGPTHPLDPRSGSQVQIRQGVVLDSGETQWWSLGVFHILRAGVAKDGNGPSVLVDLVGRSHPVKRAKIGRRWAASGSDQILASIVTVLREVAPGVPIDVDTTDDQPFGTDAIMAEWGDDVWSKCRSLAWLMFRNLHVNNEGVIVAPLRVDPSTAAPVPLIGLTARNVELDAENVVNIVGCPWVEARPDDTPEGWQPKGGVAEWQDTTSSTSVTSPIGPRRSVCGGDISVVHTPEHAALAAQADGVTRLGLQQAAAGSKVPDPRDDVGVPVDVDGTVHIVSRLTISLDGGATAVDLGASRPDIAIMMASLTKPVGEYRTTEIVTGLSPLRSKAITDPSGTEVSVTWTDALAGVEVGDPITVLHKGAGVRVGVAVLVKKNLADKFAGETVGRVGGADVTVGGNTQLRVRASGGSYANFSGGDATITVPTPDTSLDWSYSSQSVPGYLGDAGSVTLAAFNEDRHRLNNLCAAVTYMNGRLVNLDANN